MAQQNADAVHQFGGDGMLEFAGARFIIATEDVVEEPFGQPVGADQFLGVGLALVGEGDGVAVLVQFHQVLGDELIDDGKIVTGVHGGFQGGQGGGAFFLHVPQLLKMFVSFSTGVHRIYLPRAISRIRLRMPARIKDETLMAKAMVNPVLAPSSLHMATMLAKQGTNMVVMTTATMAWM